MLSLALRFLLTAGAILLYFLPSFLARNKKAFKNVVAINLILGWTIIGWCFALLLSLGEQMDQIAETRDDIETDKLEYSSAANRRRKLRH